MKKVTVHVFTKKRQFVYHIHGEIAIRFTVRLLYRGYTCYDVDENSAVFYKTDGKHLACYLMKKD